MTIVIDASVLVAALVDNGAEGKWAESILRDGPTVAPELILIESASVLRRLERGKVISTIESNIAFRDLLRLRIELFPFAPFAERIWTLRSNLTSYDAWYVAVSEALNSPLATLDLKLSRAPGPTCAFTTPG